MADIFISYASARRDLTRTLADALKAEGYSVWWDRELEAYATYRDQIDAALSEARVVVVIWSDEAARSNYVVAEAREAMTTGGAGGQGRLVNLVAPGFDPARIPKPMSEVQAAPADDIPAVIRAIARRWTGEKPERLDAAAFYERAIGAPVLSPKRETLGGAAHITPALLLNARLALAPYLDVHGLRASLGGWSREGRPARGRLVHGPGGLGKTRLMVEVCHDLREQGWAAGFVETPQPQDADIHRLAIEALIDSDRTPGLMLVLDYAERRQEEAARYAQLMLKAARARPDRPLRLVLLARAAGEWWDRIVEETPALSALFTGGVVELAAFPQVADRERLFREATEAFRKTILEERAGDPEAFGGWSLESRALPGRLQQNLESEAFARPLMIQIAALVHLQGATPDATSVASLLDAMLGVERRYWKRALGPAHTEQRQVALARGTVQTTLVGGVARAGAEQLLLRDAFFPRAAPVDVLEPLSDLERLYGDGDGRLMALEPDLVGEHLAAADGDIRLVGACLDWAGEDSERKRAILTVLQRATRAEHGARSAAALALLEHVVRTRGKALAQELIAVVFETPGALHSLLLGLAPKVDWDVASAIEEAVPQQTVKLAELGLAMARRDVVAARNVKGTYPKARARLALGLGQLGNRLSAVGRREEALEATHESVGIRRQLASENPDAFGPDLARSLNNLGNMLSDVGRREKALEATREAVGLYREIVLGNPGAFGPYLAGSLNSLGKMLSDVGRREEALEATREAVGLQRELALRNHDASKPDLAMAIMNLGAMLAAVGRREEALEATREAVGICRELASGNPDAFGPDLAASLNNLGATLSAVGCQKQALEATREAVKIQRELASRDRVAFGPDLALYLNTLGDVQIANRDAGNAMDSYREAVDVLAPIVATAPQLLNQHLEAYSRDWLTAMQAARWSNDAIDAALAKYGLRSDQFASEAAEGGPVTGGPHSGLVQPAPLAKQPQPKAGGGLAVWIGLALIMGLGGAIGLALWLRPDLAEQAKAFVEMAWRSIMDVIG